MANRNITTIILDWDIQKFNYNITHGPFCGSQTEGKADPFTI